MLKHKRQHPDVAYSNLIESVLANSAFSDDRTGTGTLSSFGHIARYDLSNNQIPLLTTKKMYHESLTHEMLWFISGDTNIRYLKKHGISIWDSWLIEETKEYRDLSFEERYRLYAKKFNDGQETRAEGTAIPFADTEANHKLLDTYDIPRTTLCAGDIGTGGYGAQWRYWEDTRLATVAELEGYHQRGFKVIADTTDGGHVVHRKIDQLANAIDLLKTNPDSRRIIVSAWNPAKVEEATLPPCHCFYVFHTELMSTQELTTAIANAGMSGDYLDSGLKHFEEHEKNEKSIHDFTVKFCEKYGIPTRKLSCLLFMR